MLKQLGVTQDKEKAKVPDLAKMALEELEHCEDNTEETLKIAAIFPRLFVFCIKDNEVELAKKLNLSTFMEKCNEKLVF